MKTLCDQMALAMSQVRRILNQHLDALVYEVCGTKNHETLKALAERGDLEIKHYVPVGRWEIWLNGALMVSVQSRWEDYRLILDTTYGTVEIGLGHD